MPEKYFNKMNRILIIFLIMIPLQVFSQLKDGYYIGLERIYGINEKGKKFYYDAPRKWYHMNHLLVKNDSILLYKEPLQIIGKDTIFSASDGAFYYYIGKLITNNQNNIISLTMTNCDYCAYKISFDTLSNTYLPVIDTLNYIITIGHKGININSVYYKSQPYKSFPVDKRLFEFKYEYIDSIQDLDYEVIE